MLLGAFFPDSNTPSFASSQSDHKHSSQQTYRLNELIVSPLPIKNSNMATLTWTHVLCLYIYIIWRMVMFTLSKLLYEYATPGPSKLPRGVPCLLLSSCLIGFLLTFLLWMRLAFNESSISFIAGPSFLSVFLSGG